MKYSEMNEEELLKAYKDYYGVEFPNYPNDSTVKDDADLLKAIDEMFATGV